MAKQPQDHKAKKRPYVFVGKDGKKHTMPYVGDAVDTSKITGREYYDAVRGGPEGQAAFMFALVASANLPDPLLDALLDRPIDEAVAIVGEWMAWGDGDGVTPGESSGSSA